MNECGKRFVEIGGTGAARTLKPGESVAERMDKGGGKRPGHRFRIERIEERVMEGFRIIGWGCEPLVATLKRKIGKWLVTLFWSDGGEYL